MKPLILIFFVVTVFQTSYGQEYDSYDFTYKVNRIYPSVSLTKSEFKKVKNISELNKYYKSSWVKEFVNMTVLTFHNGIQRKAASINDVLSAEQKQHVLSADQGSAISVIIEYYPDNTLKDNDSYIFDFNFTIDPATDAYFTDGDIAFEQYLDKHAMQQLSKSSFRQYTLRAIQFSVDTTGMVVDAHVFDAEPYGVDKVDDVDKIMLDAICNMPQWTPASYADGQKVKQDFVLRVGDMSSCISNFFNTRELR